MKIANIHQSTSMYEPLLCLCALIHLILLLIIPHLKDLKKLTWGIKTLGNLYKIAELVSSRQDLFSDNLWLHDNPIILGWSKSSFGFFCNILWNNLNKLFGQPNISKDMSAMMSKGSGQPTSLFSIRCRRNYNFLQNMCKLLRYKIRDCYFEV